MVWLLVLLVWVGLAAPAEASLASVYLAQTSAGGDTGADCSTAHAITFFNTGGNWGSSAGQIGSDTVVHLCGTITTELSVGGSGTSGHPVTVLWETGAKISKAFCSTTGCIATNGQSFLTFDGGSNGIIEATANGTSPTYANQQAGFAIRGTAGSGITIQNLTIQNLYVHTTTADTAIDNQVAIFLDGISNLTITGNTIHDTLWAIAISDTGGFSNLTITNNNLYNTDHGIGIAGSHNVTCTGLVIAGNHIHDYANWDTVANQYHHDGIHIYGAAAGGGTTYSGVLIYNNLFDGDMGENMTAQIFWETTAVVAGTSAIFNNVATLTNQPAGGSGIFAVTPASGDLGIYNNTILTAASGSGPAGLAIQIGSGSTATFSIKNNLFINAGTFIVVPNQLNASGLNNNVYTTATGSLLWDFNGTFYGTLANWRTATGQDASAVYTSGSALLSGSYIPQTNSPAIGAGANLTSLGITALNSDRGGTGRPGSGAWDAGAYQFAAVPTATLQGTATLTGKGSLQ